MTTAPIPRHHPAYLDSTPKFSPTTAPDWCAVLTGNNKHSRVRLIVRLPGAALCSTAFEIKKRNPSSSLDQSLTLISRQQPTPLLLLGYTPPNYPGHSTRKPPPVLPVQPLHCNLWDALPNDRPLLQNIELIPKARLSRASFVPRDRNDHSISTAKKIAFSPARPCLYRVFLAIFPSTTNDDGADHYDHHDQSHLPPSGGLCRPCLSCPLPRDRLRLKRSQRIVALVQIRD